MLIGAELLTKKRLWIAFLCACLLSSLDSYMHARLGFAIFGDTIA
jgi:hypothetical protein